MKANPYPIWDSHIHLDQYPREKLASTIEFWQSQGVVGVIAVATNLKTSYQLLELRLKHPEFIHVALGYHPEQELPNEKEMVELLQLINDEKENIVGIGEVGLIHYRKKELGIRDLRGYEELLVAFTKTSKNVDKPIILHAVHEEAEIALNILKENKIKKAHFHWFKANWEQIKMVKESGYTISLTPELTFRIRDQDIAEYFDIDQLLLETDGPWPLDGPYKGMLPEPVWIRDSIKKLSEIKGEDEITINKVINKNLQRLYFNPND